MGKPQLHLSVRELVEFVFRSGDIDDSRGRLDSFAAMEKGSQAHRRHQKGRGPAYRAEVRFTRTIDLDEYELVLDGRADGVSIEDGIRRIEEIKGTYRRLIRMNAPEEVHLAQALCYAWILAQEEDADAVGVTVTYIQLESGDIRSFPEIYTRDELEDWFARMLSAYYPFGQFVIRHREERTRSLADLEFPFAYRPGQRELAAAAYRSMEQEKVLFAQAPTGVGKTMAVVFPAVVGLREGIHEKIFYLTAKTITRFAAEEAFRILSENGAALLTVTLRAKEKICPQENCTCEPGVCPLARGHYDRVNEAILAMITSERAVGAEQILRYAETYQVCPFELSLDLTNFADAVIGDYNYVFDPQVKLRRFFAEGNRGEYLFLVDEAHNLVDRAREMYSADLVKEDVLAASRLLKGFDTPVKKKLNRLNKRMLTLKRECDALTVFPSPGDLPLLLEDIRRDLEELLDRERSFSGREDVLNFYFDVRGFLRALDEMDDGFCLYGRNREDGSFLLRVFCMDPSGPLGRCLTSSRSTVFFSATLLPVRYYKELLCGNAEEDALYIPSPFDTNKRLLVLARDVTSRYRARGEAMYARIARYIDRTRAAKPGNYLVFFPSYAFLEAVAKLIPERDGTEILVQKREMREEEREAFLEGFHNTAEDRSVLGLCVMGGIFSEGIDLVGEKLIGTIVVGTGLPGIDEERELLKAYFEKRSGDGFAYAYRYPGMNRVAQAAGRLIRSMDDTGVILLLDERFLSPEYRELFPREWSEYRVTEEKTLSETLEAFWKGIVSYGSSVSPESEGGTIIE